MQDNLEGLRAQPWFSDAREHVTRPDRLVPASVYFCERWIPKLGPTATALVLYIRAVLVTRRDTDDMGAVDLPPQSQLGLESGIGGPKRIREALRVLEGAGFLVRRARYEYDRTTGQTRHLPDRYLVAMTDPVAPEDEGRLLCVAGQRIADGDQQAFHNPERDGRNGPHTSAEKAHTRGDVGAEMAATVASACTPGPVGAETAARTLERQRRNVGTFSQSEKANGLVDELVHELQDERSRRWFALVVGRMPEDVVRACMSEARDARRCGRLKRSAGAYFTDLIKRRADEIGVQLKGGRCS